MFNIPGPFGPDVPFAEMHVWQWAKTQPRDNVDLLTYLESLGFVLDHDRLTEDQLRTLEYAIDSFHRVAPHIVDIMRFGEAFTPADSGGFYVQGKPGRWVPSEKLRLALINAGWIYEVIPDTTYFAVINGKVWAKYQQIIGSRPLVQLSE